jgi:hypothetical protein
MDESILYSYLLLNCERVHCRIIEYDTILMWLSPLSTAIVIMLLDHLRILQIDWLYSLVLKTVQDSTLISIEQSKLCLSITPTSDQGSYHDTTIQWVHYYQTPIDDVSCSHQATDNSCSIQGANFSTHKAAHHKQSNSLTHIQARTMCQSLLWTRPAQRMSRKQGLRWLQILFPVKYMLHSRRWMRHRSQSC